MTLTAPKDLFEPSRPDKPLEWWFVQGRFAGEGVAPRNFMLALFRHALQWGSLSAGNGWTLLVSVLDPATGRSAFLSQVDEAAVPFLIAAAKLAPPAGLDSPALQAMIDEMSEYGPPRPIRAEPQRPSTGTNPFHVAWGDFALEQKGDGFLLGFAEPEADTRYTFRLTPAHPPVHLANVAMPGGGEMDHVFSTRLMLAGEANGAAVSGEAWLDHQWDSQGWFVAGKQERVFGWDRFGIHLADGRELLVMAHRDQRQKDPLCQYAVLVEESGAAKLHREVVLTPTSWWTSPATGTRYPLAWRIEIPAVALVIDFEPLASNQEIPLLPPMRAVWEGAGRVNGTCGGRVVAGHARLELYGHAYVTDLRLHVSAVVTRIQHHIETFLPRTLRLADILRFTGSSEGNYNPPAQTYMLATPLWDLMDRSGKQWWAIFGILTLGALGIDPEPYEPLASVIAEMIHSALVIIDDIQDGGQMRRGHDAIHCRYGVDVAINAGGTAYFLPFAFLADYPGLSDAQRLEIYRILSRLYVRAHLGQAQDVYWSKFLTAKRLREWREDSLEEKLLQVYANKTGSLTEAAAEGACVIANANVETRTACASFGRSLGMAIQIVNDIANFSATRAGRGDIGSDLRDGKLSFVICRALQRLGKQERDRLEAIFCSQKLRQSPDALAEAVELVRRSGALEATQQFGREMLEGEWKKLSAVLPPSEPKTMLRVLWTFLLGLGDDAQRADFAPA